MGQRKSEARRWFQQGRYDLRAARWNIEGGFNDTASFLAQQYPHHFYGRETAEQAVRSAEKIVQVVTDYYSSMNEMEILAEDEEER